MIDMICWLIASTILLILAIIRYRRMRAYQHRIQPVNFQIQVHPTSHIRAPRTLPKIQHVQIDISQKLSQFQQEIHPIDPSSMSRDAEGVGMGIMNSHLNSPLSPQKSPFKRLPLPDSNMISTRKSNFIQDTLPILFLIQAMLFPQRLMNWSESFYGQDSTAMWYQSIDIIVSNARTFMLYVMGTIVAYITISVAYVSVTLSPLPRSVRYLCYLLTGLWLTSTILSFSLEIALNKRWPAGVHVAFVITMVCILYTVFVCAVRKFTSRLMKSSADATSRARATERVAHLRRGLIWGGIVIILSVFSCVALTVIILSDWDAPFLQIKHSVSYVDWIQMVFLSHPILSRPHQNSKTYMNFTV